MTVETLAGIIRDGISASMELHAPPIVDTVMRALFNHKAYALIAGGQLRLMQAGIKPVKAWNMSRDCLAEFMKDEKVEFGDPRYAWDAEDGRVLVEEFEIQHWEAS